MTELSAVLLNCTLKAQGESSTDVLLGEVSDELVGQGVRVAAPIRVAALDIKPGVSSDEGDGDEWPDVRSAILDADVLVVGTPIWMGQPSSVAKRVLERLDAFLGEEDDEGRMVSWDRVALVAVVGNEDGAHHVCAELFQALSDVGFHRPGQRLHLLGRRGDAGDRLQGPRPPPGHDAEGHEDGGDHGRPPSEAPPRRPLPGGVARGPGVSGRSRSAATVEGPASCTR